MHYDEGKEIIICIISVNNPWDVKFRLDLYKSLVKICQPCEISGEKSMQSQTINDGITIQ